MVQEGEGVGIGGGVGGLWHGSRTEKVADQGYKNFVFPNHQKKKVRYSL